VGAFSVASRTPANADSREDAVAEYGLRHRASNSLEPTMARNDAYRIAEEKIAEAKRSGAGILDLSVKFSENEPQLTELPESLRELTRLHTLTLNGNRLTRLPEWLGQLAQLRVLSISNNQLITLPESVGQLTQLRVLTLSHNHLSVLPESIGQLTNLNYLFLWNNRLTILPDSLGQLKNLKTLTVLENQLQTLPDSLSALSSKGVLVELCLHDNPDLGLPDEVLGPPYATSGPKNPPKPPKEILDYYFSTRGGAGQALRELRLIVVGRPKVGKTSLIRRLRGLPMDLHEAETHGIDILPLDLKCADGPLHARVWDFGGQHVLHAMHEFFLRSRCLYLLVVEQRSNDVERELTYWLQLIRSYAGNAPVVVALNQSKGIPRSTGGAGTRLWPYSRVDSHRVRVGGERARRQRNH